MEKAKTIEQQVADAILQRDSQTLEIDGKTYNIAPPSVATLILISEVISTLPIMESIPDTDPQRQEKVFAAVMRSAKDFRALGEIAAILILGAKGLTGQETQEIEEPVLFGLFKRKRKYGYKADRKAELANAILENVSASTLYDLLLNRINLLDIGNFFAITTSLSEANILKPTKEVEQ